MWQGCKPSNGTKLFLQNICFITYDMAQLLWTVYSQHIQKIDMP